MRRTIKSFYKKNGAEDGTWTRDPHLGKVMLYQLSYFRLMQFSLIIILPLLPFFLQNKY